MTFSMAEKSCDEVPDTAEAEAEADADALGTKAWVLDAEAARRSRAERVLLPIIITLANWLLIWTKPKDMMLLLVRRTSGGF